MVLAWLWFGLTFTSLLNLMRECAHRLAFRRRRSSDLLGRWVLGPLPLADFDAYRERHWAHHRNLGVDGDTKDDYLIDIRGVGFVRLLLGCLCLRRAARKLTQQAPPATEEVPVGQGVAIGAPLARTAAIQAIVFGAIPAVAAVAHDGIGRVLGSALLASGFVYLYGLAALAVFAAALRAVAEHQVDENEALVQGRAALRNFRSGPLTGLVFGSYGFANHATHHREPGIPHYRLATVTAELAPDEPGLVPAGGYLSILWRLGRHRRAPLATPSPG